MSRKKELLSITLWSTIVNLVLLLFKLMAGIVGRSSAMIADAVHSISDFATDLVVYIFISLAARPQDEDHDYGHGKYETLATTIIGVILFFVGLGLFWEGASKIYGFYFLGETLPKPKMIALIAAMVSIVAKELLFQFTYIIGKRENSSTIIANAWHHRSDALSSIGAAIGVAGAMWLGEGWVVLDPIAGLLVSLLVLKVAYDLTLPAINELLEKSLPPEIENEMLEIISQDPAISHPHNLRTRKIGNKIAIELHLRMDGAMNVATSHEITKRVEQKLRDKYGPETHIAIHVEPVKDL